MENITGIGYVVYSDSREQFLGRMGIWSPDVRLAQVYAEPRAAKMAIVRLDEPTLTYPVPVSMLVTQRNIETGRADQMRRDEKSSVETNGPAKQAKPQPVKKPT